MIKFPRAGNERSIKKVKKAPTPGENSKQTVSIFFAKADILSEKNPYFGKHLFAKQELITRARRSVQDFATGKNFSFNQDRNKEFAFFLGRVIL